MTPVDADPSARVTSTVQEVRRALLIVLLSHDSRTILLERQPGRSAWWPLRVDVPPHHSYARALHQWQRRWGRRTALRRGAVSGRLRIVTAREHRDYLVVILKLAREEASEMFSPHGLWVPIGDLGSATVFPQELAILMTGYVEGWIPDGPLTLDA